jgi:murein L,D-transpeptidase YafK
MGFSRVAQAFLQNHETLTNELSEVGFELQKSEIHFRVFKMEQDVEIWVRHMGTEEWSYFKSYKFCSSSGTLGPKWAQGDHQIPEGFYRISRFNPFSNFHLSLGINYPNKVDSLRIKNSNMGGDIFFHGGCRTVGCIPVTNKNIQELYVLAVEAKNNGQKNIPVHIYPCRLSDENYKSILQTERNTITRKFWGNLKTGYTLFNQNHIIPQVGINVFGQYIYY